MAEAKKGNRFFGWFKKVFKGIGKWFRGMKSELKKVVWPSWSQLLNNTLVVIVVSIIVAIIVGVFDFGAMKGIEALLGLVG